MTECEHEWGDVTSICKKCGLVLGKGAIERTVRVSVRKELDELVLKCQRFVNGSVMLDKAEFIQGLDSIFKEREAIP